MRFSERYGYKPVREIIQKDAMSDDLRNRIWSLIYSSFFKLFINNRDFAYEYLYVIEDIWSHYCKLPLDEMKDIYLPPYRTYNIEKIKNYIFQNEWFSIYELLEFILKHEGSTKFHFNNLAFEPDFTEKLNNILKEEGSAYSLIKRKFILITSEQEIQSIEDALENTNPYSGVQQHLNQALKLMSDRTNPNYSKSMHDSISAVEGLAKILLEDDSITLGKAIPKLRTKYSLHPVLMESLNKLYGYTSDEDGIRHGSPNPSAMSYIDAKFMLVACTNFINYLIEKIK